MKILNNKSYKNIYKKNYKKHGYTLIPCPNKEDYKSLINDIHAKYSNYLQNLNHKNFDSNNKLAFRDKSGNPRHVIDILRDKKSSASKIFKHQNIKKIISHFTNPSKRYIFTHSKLSFKTIGKDASWSPHQDNGYKKFKKRDGFAIFICLEDMNLQNGALEVFHESHKLGTLPHVRRSESSSGDGQYVIEEVNIPSNLKKIVLAANAGDIIIFHQDCIHMSSQTKNDSQRLAFIFEIEKYKNCELDDYGLVPIFLQGKLSFLEKLITLFKTQFSPLRIWLNLSKYPFLKKKIRKLILIPLGIIKGN